MAQTKVAPTFVDEDTFFVGKVVTLIEITYPECYIKTGPVPNPKMSEAIMEQDLF